MSDEINIKDESGDKKYFTIVPNIILNHSTANAQALYLQLKRLAGENGIACCGQRYLKKQLGMAHNTIKREFGYLLEKGWIKYAGEQEVMTDGGMQKMKSYKIVDLWQLNIKEYQNQHTLAIKGYQNEHRGVSNEARRGVKISTKEELNNIKNIVASDTPYSLKEEIKKLEDSPRRDLNIVALYFEHRKPDLQNREQYEIALKRHLKPAGVLKNFTDTQILKALDYAKKEYKEMWTIETLEKILTK